MLLFHWDNPSTQMYEKQRTISAGGTVRRNFGIKSKLGGVGKFVKSTANKGYKAVRKGRRNTR